MHNKIIAAACVVLLLIATFAACGKVPTIKMKEGMEYPLVTDEAGSTVLDKDGNVLVYVTDEHGKYVKDESGERQTNAVTFPAVVVKDGKVETADYVLSVPEGWTADSNGRLTKENTGDAKVYIEMTNFGKLNKDGGLAAYNAESFATLEEYAETVKQNGGEGTLISEDIQFQGQDTKLLGLSIHADSADAAYKMIYFMKNGDLLKLLYSCDGAYDEEMDLIAFAEQNLTVK